MKKSTIILALLFLSISPSIAQKYQEFLNSADIYFAQEKYFEAYERYNAARVFGKNIPSVVAKGEIGMDKSIVGIKKQKKMADSLLIVSEEMQSKMETAVFDRAVKQRNRDWRGYNNYSYEEREERIKILVQVDSLDFSNNSLYSIPDEISKCPRLRHINLIGNRNIDLNASLEKIKTQTFVNSVFVSTENLTNIDSNYHNLITGIDISAYYNEYGDRYGERDNLPPEIKKFTYLSYLNIEFQGIENLLPEIESLTNLTHLNLNYTPLTLPKEIENLTNLTYLSFLQEEDYNEDVEEYIGRKSILNICDVFENFPKEIIISINTNRQNNDSSKLLIIVSQQSIPSNIGNLTNLTKLDLGVNLFENYLDNYWVWETKPKARNSGGFGRYNYDYLEIDNTSDFWVDLFLLNDYSNSRDIIKSEKKQEYYDFNDGMYRSNTDSDEWGDENKRPLYDFNFDGKNYYKEILPPEIGHLTHLTELNLNGHYLSSLPPEIGDLSNLTELNLDNNYLTFLPKEIGNLTNSIYLKLWDNEITNLPPEIGNLSNLTKINLAGNNLTTLPVEIGNLSNLTYLDISGNPIILLPLELKEYLQNIEYFITDEPLEHYFNSEAIEDLNLNNMGLTDFPSEIESLPNLKALYLHNNKLSELPKEIKNLQNLTYLGLKNNKLNSLPKQIGKLSNLILLDLYGNDSLDITSLSDAFKNYPRDITIINQDWYPDNFDSSSLFITIPIQNNFPSEILNITNLSKLILSNYQLTDVPPEIENLTNLTELILFRCQITNIPPEIGNLTNLTVLNLFYNKITSLPPEIKNLTNLKELNLGGNNISKEEKEKIRNWLPNCEIKF
jgi:Leucine-rich repeat (LRR) protein